MDKFLRPERFEADPNSPNAAKEWIHWFKTFQNFLASLPSSETGLGEEQKLRLLINYISHSIYELISDYTSYTECVDVLQNVYVKKPNELFARHLLATRRQRPGESINQYLLELQLLSKDCNFKSVDAEQNKNDYIRDAFITGLLSSQIRQRLLENSTLDLKQAVIQSQTLEKAQENTEAYKLQGLGNSSCSIQDSRNSLTDGSINHIPTSTSATSQKHCYFCGKIYHPRIACPARNEICTYCKKMGHFAIVCLKSKANTKFVKKSTTASTFSFLATSDLIHSSSSLTKTLISCKINNLNAMSLIDTGSSESYLDYDFAVGHNLKIFPCSHKVIMASTSLSSDIKGYCIITLLLLGHNYQNIKISLLPNLCSNVIIGHDILQQHSSLNINFGGPKSSLSICCLMEAKVECPRLFGNLHPNCKPIVTKSRRHSEDDENFINNEIQNLLKEGIIEESVSPWRAQVLVISSTNHKKRMVIDYSQTINKYTLLDAYPLPNIEQLVENVAKYEVFSTIDLKSAYHQIPIKDSEKQFTAFEASGKLYQFRRIPFGVTNGVACFQRVIHNIITKENLSGVFAYLDDVTICGENQLEHDKNLEKFLSVAKKYGLSLNENKCSYSKTSINLLGYSIENKTLRPDPDRLKPLLDLKPPEDVAALRRIIGMFAHYSKWIPRFSQKICNIRNCKSFPFTPDLIEDFENLKQDIAKAFLCTMNDTDIPVVETDASDCAIAATLSQNGRPVAFFTRTLSSTERRHSAIEKEAYAIVEALRKWRHFLLGRHFQLITDQESVSFMFRSDHSRKIKNEKILRWRLELSCFNYDIIYRPGPANVVSDCFSRVCGATNHSKLFDLHQSLCHPGITRMYHLVRSRNLPYSLENIKEMTASCPICSEIKPQFFKNPKTHLIKATNPFDRLNIDFKGPLPSNTRNKYMLTVVDEYSRFPFAFPCPNLHSSTVINCLTQLFSIFGLPSYIHSDRGSSFMSKEFTDFLHSLNISVSRTTPYNPEGNGQVERYNGIIWKTINLALKTRKLQSIQWEVVLPDALHSIRSLLCTSTNCTPHERMFKHERRASQGTSLPSWLYPSETVLMKKNVRHSKYDPLVEEVEIVEVNPNYAVVRNTNGNESTVSIKHLAPRGDVSLIEDVSENPSNSGLGSKESTEAAEENGNINTSAESEPVRKSSRAKQPPSYLKDFVSSLNMGRM